MQAWPPEFTRGPGGRGRLTISSLPYYGDDDRLSPAQSLGGRPAAGTGTKFKAASALSFFDSKSAEKQR